MVALTSTKTTSTLAIVQITRIGDVLQTYQVASEFKRQFPAIRLVLIARDQFAGGLRFLLETVFDSIHLLNYRHMRQAGNLDAVQSELHAFTQAINNENIDVLVNLSFSKSSSYLCSLIKAKNKFGLNRNSNADLEIQDRWSQFVYSNVMGGANNPFSIVDIYKSILGVTLNSYSTRTPTNLDKSKIVVHPFASHPRKAWPMTKWAELIQIILRDNPLTKITLVGGPADETQSHILLQAESLKRFSHRITCKVGEGTLEDFYHEFDDARLFIGHDSMGGHMASIKGIQSITVSLGTVRPHETTPYGNFNYNLSPRTKCFPCYNTDRCELLPCHKDVSPQSVAVVTKGILENITIGPKYIRDHIVALLSTNTKIYASEIDEKAGMHLTDIADTQSDTPDIFKKLYRITWNFLNRGLDENLPLPELSDTNLRELTHYSTGIVHFYELNNFGIKYSNFILDELASKSPNIAAIKDYSKRLEEVDQLTMLIKKTFPLLAPIVDLTNIAKSNLRGETIGELAQSALITYHDSNSAVRILHDLSETLLSHYRNSRIVKGNRHEVGTDN